MIRQGAKKVIIDDPDEAQSVLLALLEDANDTSWAQFRYRLVRGGPGLGMEQKATNGVLRDLKRLSLEEAGHGGMDDLRRSLPSNEVAYVVYNNVKGAKVEDRARQLEKYKEGTRWKDWVKLIDKETHRFMKENLLEWAGYVQAIYASAEVQRLQGLFDICSIFVPSEVSNADPVDMVEEMCGITESLNKVLLEGLDLMVEHDGEEQDAQIFAVQHVVAHLEKNAAAIKEQEEKEAALAKKAASMKRKETKARWGGTNYNWPSRRGQGANASTAQMASKPKAQPKRTGKAASKNEVQSPESSAPSSPDVGPETSDFFRMRRPSSVGIRTPSAEGIAKTRSVDSVSGDPIMEYDEDGDDDFLGRYDEDEDTMFKKMIEHEARQKAAQMERSSMKIQAMGRGMIARSRLRKSQIQAGTHWTQKMIECRGLDVLVLLVWSPPSARSDMLEMTVYHLRNVVDFINTIQLEEIQRLDDYERLSIVSAEAEQSPDLVRASPPLLDDLAPLSPRKKKVQLPYVVHKGSSAAEMTSHAVATTVVANYREMEGQMLIRPASPDAQSFTVTFPEQELYRALLIKYADILNDAEVDSPKATSKGASGPGSKREDTAKSRLEARLAYTGHVIMLQRSQQSVSSLATEEMPGEASWSRTQVEALPNDFQFASWWTLKFPVRDRQRAEARSAKTANKDSGDGDEERQVLRKMMGGLDVGRRQSRTPSLKSYKQMQELYAGMDAHAFLKMYHFKCKHLGVAPRVENERAFLQMITKCCTNDTFRLRECGIESEATKVLVKNLSMKQCTLTCLDLSRNPLGDDGAKQLASLLRHTHSLTQLDLEAASIEQAGQTALFYALVNDNTTLTALDLGTQGNNGRNMIGAEGSEAARKALLHNQTLSSLSLSSNRLSASQAAAFMSGLTKNGILQKLDLSDNHLRDEGIVTLASAIQGGGLTELLLARNDFTDQGGCALATALKTSKPPVHRLDLAGNRVSTRAMKAFSAIMTEKNTVLADLNLDGNNLNANDAEWFSVGLICKVLTITDKHGKPIDALINYPRALTSLRLSHNNLGDQGATHIANILATNTTLTLLDLSHNGIADDGATELGKAVKCNSTLTHLGLAWNKIKDVGFTAFAAELCDQPVLQHLDVQGNKLDAGAGTALIEMLTSCTALTSLSLEYMNITFDQHQCLRKLLKKNSAHFNQGSKDHYKDVLAHMTTKASHYEELFATLSSEKRRLQKLNARIEDRKADRQKVKKGLLEDEKRAKREMDKLATRESKLNLQYKIVADELKDVKKEWDEILDEKKAQVAESEDLRDQLRKRLTELHVATAKELSHERTVSGKLLIDLDVHKGLEQKKLKERSVGLASLKTFLMANYEDERTKIEKEAWALVGDEEAIEREQVIQQRRIELRESLADMQTPQKDGILQRASKRLGQAAVFNKAVAGQAVKRKAELSAMRRQSVGTSGDTGSLDASDAKVGIRRASMFSGTSESESDSESRENGQAKPSAKVAARIKTGLDKVRPLMEVLHKDAAGVRGAGGQPKHGSVVLGAKRALLAPPSGADSPLSSTSSPKSDRVHKEKRAAKRANTPGGARESASPTQVKVWNPHGSSQRARPWTPDTAGSSANAKSRPWTQDSAGPTQARGQSSSGSDVRRASTAGPDPRGNAHGSRKQVTRGGSTRVSPRRDGRSKSPPKQGDAKSHAQPTDAVRVDRPQEEAPSASAEVGASAEGVTAEPQAAGAEDQRQSEPPGEATESAADGAKPEVTEGATPEGGSPVESAVESAVECAVDSPDETESAPVRTRRGRRRSSVVVMDGDGAEGEAGGAPAKTQGGKKGRRGSVVAPTVDVAELNAQLPQLLAQKAMARRGSLGVAGLDVLKGKPKQKEESGGGLELDFLANLAKFQSKNAERNQHMRNQFISVLQKQREEREAKDREAEEAGVGGTRLVGLMAQKFRIVAEEPPPTPITVSKPGARPGAAQPATSGGKKTAAGKAKGTASPLPRVK